MIARKVRRLAPYVYGEQPQGADVVKLNTNEAAYPPSRKVIAELRRIKPEALRRYPDASFRALRRELAKLYGAKEECIFVGNGSDEILSLMTDAFVEDRQTIGSLDPSYSLYKVLAAIRGVDWRGFGRLPAVVPKDLAVFFLTSPNNPTGALVPPQEVAAFARRFKGVLVVDEAYVEYASANCMKLATSPRNRNVIVMRTFSKAYSLAGLRVGYCVGPRDLVDALYKIKDSYNVDAVAQSLALAAVKDQKGLRATVSKVLKTRAWFAAELVKRGWDIVTPEANFVFARPPVSRGSGRAVRTARVAEHLFLTLRERNIYIRYFKGPKTGDHVRITIGTDAQMRRVLHEIDDILKTKGV